MAQAGFTPILLYYSSTASNVPTAGNLANGELAINITDGKLFYKDNLGVVQTLASKASVTNVASLSFGTTGLTPSTATTGAITVAGTLIAANGGTGQSSYAVGDLLYASTTTALSKLADVATGNALISGGVGVAPSYGKIGLTTHVSGTLPIANGGTNATATPTAGAIAYGTGTAYAFNIAGTSGQPLLSGGSGAPTFGTLSVGAGGTGQTAYTDGQLLIGNTATTSLSKATLTAGSGVTITNGNGSITIAATGSGGTVTSVGQTFTGGLISVAGSPVTTSGTLALTVAGISGGIPYFSGASTWASSAALAANALVIGGGAGAAPSTTTTGTGVLTALSNNANATGGVATTDGTATLTNKRINPRTSSTTSTATLTPDISAADQYNLTAQAVGLTVAAPTGTPVDGNRLIIRILDNGVSQTISWNATYTVVGVTLPTATTASKMTYVGCIYNSANTRWDVVAVTTQA